MSMKAGMGKPIILPYSIRKFLVASAISVANETKAYANRRDIFSILNKKYELDRISFSMKEYNDTLNRMIKDHIVNKKRVKSRTVYRLDSNYLLEI